MKQYINMMLILMASLIPTSSYAQLGPNLVPNPGFENTGIYPRPFRTDTFPGTISNSENPRALHYIMRGDSSLTQYIPQDRLTTFDTSQRAVRRWFRGNMGTSDYYHTNAEIPIRTSTGVIIPANQGVKIPNVLNADTLYPYGTGNAYVGIAIARTPGAGTSDEYREYLACKLLSPISYGPSYMVRFRYSMGNYINENERARNQRARYYLKKLGVAFLQNPLPIHKTTLENVNTFTWITQTSQDFTNTMELSPTPHQLIEENNLPYAEAPDWGTFEAYFTPTAGNLEYMVIGNFDQKIDLQDIIPIRRGDNIPGNPNNQNPYSFYFYIDSVEVRQLENADSCNCTSIFTCPHTRNEELQATNPDKCCFSTPIIRNSTSCEFRFIRVKRNNQVISSPQLIDYGDYVPVDSMVFASFCIDYQADETPVTIQYEFLDEDSNVVCLKAGTVFCHCDCGLASANIAPGVPIKVLEGEWEKTTSDSNQCCWLFKIKNNYSCTFRDSLLTIHVQSFGDATITTMSPWVKTMSGSIHNFKLPGGLQYNSTSTVFKVCTSEKSGATVPSKISINITRLPIAPNQGPSCANFDAFPLECVIDTNCCDLLEVQLRKKSELAYGDCQFEVIVRQKNSPAKCKVFGVRIRKAADSLIMHSTGTSGTPLDLDDYTYIWEDDLGSDCPQSLTPGYQVSRTYIIEFLDSTGAVKCSTQKTFQCCYSSGGPSSSKQGTIEVSTQKQTSLSIGGSLTNITLDAKHLRYTFTNYDEQDNGRAWIALVDIRGQKVIEKPIALRPGTNSGDIDIMGIHNGTYYLVLRTDKWQTSKQCSIIK